MTVCQPIDEVDGALVDYIRATLLTDDLISQAVAEVRTEVERELTTGSVDAAGVETQIKALRLEEARLGNAIARVPDAETLIEQLRERVANRRRLEAMLIAAKRTPLVKRALLAQVEAMARAKLGDLRSTLEADREGRRQVFQEMFPPGLLRSRRSRCPGPGASLGTSGGSRAPPVSPLFVTPPGHLS